MGSMTLSRSPSPRLGGGWSSPGLTSPGTGGLGPTSSAFMGSLDGSSVMWEPARATSQGLHRGSYPAFATRSGTGGFFNRHYRKLSASLPRFALGGDARRGYAEREKLGRGRWGLKWKKRWTRLRLRWSRTSRRAKWRLFFVLAVVVMYLTFYMTREFLPDAAPTVSDLS